VVDAGTQRVQARPVKLGPAEYFVLGDNSPVSIDIRSWENPAVSPALTQRYQLALQAAGTQARTLGAEATWAGLHAIHSTSHRKT